MIENSLKSILPIWHFVISQWLILLFLVVAGRIFYLRYLHPLRAVPGPFLAAVSELWYLGCVLRGQQHLGYVEAHKKYGPVVRIRPNTVILNDPISYTPYFQWDKSDFWLAFRGHPVHMPHANELDVRKHVDKKKKIMGGYQMSPVLKNERKMDSHVQELMNQLAQRANVKMDLAPWLQYTAADIVMEMVFSQPMGFLKSGTDVGNVNKAIDDTLLGASVAAAFPWISKLVYHPWIFPFIGPKPSDKNGLGRVLRVGFEQVDARVRPHSTDSESKPTQYHDILQSMIDHKDERGEHISADMLRLESFAPVLAGIHSTASALRAAILYVSSNSRILSKLRSQIEAADAQSQLSVVPTSSEVQQHIPYVDAIIKETLRIYPIAGGPLSRSVPSAGHNLKFSDKSNSPSTPRTYFLPGRTEVGVSQWAVSRNPAVFGVNADTFVPERWMDQNCESGLTPEERRLRDAGNIFFSDGPMMCTGRNVANVEMRKVLTQFFRTFDVQIVDPTRPWKDYNTLGFVHWDFWVVLKRRQVEQQ